MPSVAHRRRSGVTTRDDARAWLTLVAAGGLEVIWSLALERADGLTRLLPSLVGLGVAMVSLGLLSVALRRLPVGPAYAAWVGIGTAGVSLTGMVALGEPAGWGRVACVALIVTGVVGLSLSPPGRGAAVEGAQEPSGAGTP